MTYTEKDYPGAVTPEQSIEPKTATIAISDSNQYHSTNGNKRQPGKIEQNLLHGAENAASIDYLLGVTGYKNARNLQSAIARERENGALILSSNRSGYYLPDITDSKKAQCEIAQYVSTLRSRALNTLKVLKTARRALSTVESQLSFYD